MAIKRSTRTVNAPARRTITAGTNINAGVRNRQAKNIMASSQRFKGLTVEQQRFARQIESNYKRMTNVMAATNTSNIMARPDFLEMLPMFVQKLVALDVYGSVAMRSRQQMIPYFKFISEVDKGETKRGQILNSPFVNRQGLDPNFTGRVVKNEECVNYGMGIHGLQYTPILPGSVTLEVTDAEGNVTKLIDDGNGGLVNAAGEAQTSVLDYATGNVNNIEGTVRATYQYDNENVGPDTAGNYGAKMAKGYLQLDEINLVAEAHEIACYWSVYSAFAAQNEYGANIAEMAKDAAFAELTAEINTACFDKLLKAASYKPQFNWDASPVLAGSVVPSDYLNMFKLKLGQAAAAIYQETRLARPNKLVVGTTCAEYIAMIDGFKAENIEDTVGPYKFGKLDQFDIYVDPNYEVNTWVMCSKSNDIRRCSALFGEYMPLTNTDALGFPTMEVGIGGATMYAAEVVNPHTVVSGKLLGTF